MASTTTALRAKPRNDDSRGSPSDRKNSKSNKKPTVAIIGGGVAGLSCARHLQHSYDVTVVSSNELVSLYEIFGRSITSSIFVQMIPL